MLFFCLIHQSCFVLLQYRLFAVFLLVCVCLNYLCFFILELKLSKRVLLPFLTRATRCCSSIKLKNKENKQKKQKLFCITERFWNANVAKIVIPKENTMFDKYWGLGLFVLMFCAVLHEGRPPTGNRYPNLCNWVTTVELTDQTPSGESVAPLGFQTVNFSELNELKQNCLDYAKDTHGNLYTKCIISSTRCKGCGVGLSNATFHWRHNYVCGVRS